MKIRGDTVFIPLNRTHHMKRKFAMIDAEEAERVLRNKWYAVPSGTTWYVRATSDRLLPTHHMSLHNFIMRSHKGERFDHENGNGLDCRKSNLRPATPAQNARNTFKTNSPHVTSKFKGVTLTSSGKWFASLTFEGKHQSLGMYEEEHDAARAYDEAALRLFGAFAKTNADMGLYDNDTPIRDVDLHAQSAKHITKAQFFGVEPKPRWQEYLEGEEPDIDRSIPHRDRRRSPEALARRKAKKAA